MQHPTFQPHHPRSLDTLASSNVLSMLHAMDRSLDESPQYLHQLISRSFRHRQHLWTLVLATYRVELTALLDRAAQTGFDPADKSTLGTLAHQIIQAATAVDQPSIRSEASSLQTLATNDLSQENTANRVLVVGLRLIDRILDAERARQDADSTQSKTYASS